MEAALALAACPSFRACLWEATLTLATCLGLSYLPMGLPWPWQRALALVACHERLPWHWQCALTLVACHERWGIDRTSKPSSCPTRALWSPHCRCGPRGCACGLRCKTLCGYGAFGPLCQHTKGASSLYLARLLRLFAPFLVPWRNLQIETVQAQLQNQLKPS
nr:hypothetical protein CFP56_72282 [Quercus suber]